MVLFDTNRFCKSEEKQGSIPGFLTISKDIMSIVWASMIESFLVALVTLFDGIQVAVIGNEANAAVTICKQPYFILIAIITSLNIAVSAVIARRKGSNDVESANKTLHFAIVASIVISLILSFLFVLFAKPICLLMQAREDTLPYAVPYLTILSGGFVFNALRMSINACQKGIGKTHISMISNIIANIVNVALNYVLIGGHLFFPKMGIYGAGIATIIGNFVACLISFLSLFKEKDFLKFRFSALFLFGRETMRPVFHLLPSVLIEQIFMRIGFIIYGVIVNHLGTSDTYIHGLCMDINSLLFTLADGFSIGTAAVVGHRLGEKRKDLAIVYAKVAMILSISVALFMMILVIFFRKQLIMLYKPDDEYKFKTASQLLIVAAIGVIPQNIQWVNTGILRSAGDSKFTAKTSLISVMILRPSTAYLLCYVCFGGLGIYGAWISQIIDQLIRMVCNLWRFHSRKWIDIKV